MALPSSLAVSSTVCSSAARQAPSTWHPVERSCCGQKRDARHAACFRAQWREAAGAAPGSWAAPALWSQVLGTSPGRSRTEGCHCHSARTLRERFAGTAGPRPLACFSPTGPMTSTHHMSHCMGSTAAVRP